MAMDVPLGGVRSTRMKVADVYSRELRQRILEMAYKTSKGSLVGTVFRCRRLLRCPRVASCPGSVGP